jgi:hypothetical protein
MSGSAIELLIDPQTKDLGEFTVRRTLPARQRQRVGPFIFFDHMGPADFPAGSGVNVRAHPHIGIATITYLFAGKILHRDSLGNSQVIEKGAVNWMTAGKGIVHSERTPPNMQTGGSHLHGIQSWVALPVEHEETDPGFEHYAVEVIPQVILPGAQISVITGTAYGQTSPVLTSSETLYVEANLQAGAELNIADNYDETAVYVVSGDIAIDSTLVAAGTMAVLKPGDAISMTAQSPAKCMLLGGATLGGERTIWWNFVSSSKERIEQAKKDWREKRFAPVPDESEFIPLPEK